MDIHKKPKTKEEVLELFDIIETQRLELLYEPSLMITCAGCKDRVRLKESYHCYYCELWLCLSCSKEHFGKRPIGALAKEIGDNRVAPANCGGLP